MPVIQDQANYSKRNAPISVSGSEANEEVAAALEDAVDVNLTSHYRAYEHWQNNPA